MSFSELIWNLESQEDASQETKVIPSDLDARQVDTKDRKWKTGGQKAAYHLLLGA